MKIALGISSGIFAFFGALAFINAKTVGSNALWIAIACNSISGFGLSYALVKNNSLRNLYAIFLVVFLCMVDVLALAFGGCARLL